MKKAKVYKLFFLFIFYNPNTFSCEFLYPVAAINQNGQSKIYVLYQKSIDSTELWIWDPETKRCSKDLLSSYTPASLKILPNLDGFSFIDCGRIRVKKFNKRSPKSIDLYEPVYDISQLNWIDEQNFYVSAKKNNKFCIFHISDSGLIKSVLDDENFDFMYPQKICNSLFYIERVVQDGEYKKNHISYKIAKTVYPDLCEQINNLENQLKNSEDFDFNAKKIQTFTDNCDLQKFSKQNSQYLANFKNSPIAFLNMISETEGFFLKHETNICKHDEVINFEYFSIKLENEIWKNEKIFSFSIPTPLILEKFDFSLYESILPLLPKYYNNKIYFVNFDTSTKNLNIFSYDLSNKRIEQKSFFQESNLREIKTLQNKQTLPKPQNSQILFSPIFIDNFAYCGGKIDYTKSCPIKMWISENGSICMDFIKIRL